MLSSVASRLWDAPSATGGIVAAYVLLYTGFSKESKSLDLRHLWHVISFGHARAVRARPATDVKKGELSWALMQPVLELNKVLGLASITLLSSVVWPGVSVPTRRAMARDGVNMLVAHGIFSAVHFRDRFRLASGKLWSMLLGVAALVCSTFWAYPTAAVLLERVYDAHPAAGTIIAFGIPLGALHFYTMELDRNGVLQVRPFGKVALASSVIASGLILGTFVDVWRAQQTC
jgi:hypothetical protein